MKYDYLTTNDPPAKKIKKTGNKIIIAIVVIIGIIAVGIGLSGTGQVTASDEICAGLEECKKLAAGAEAVFQQCSTDLTETREANEELEVSLSLCTKEKQDYESSYIQEVSNYRSLVRSTAFTMCCTSADSDRGAIKSFSITNNKLICNTGEFSVNCRTGGTSY